MSACSPILSTKSFKPKYCAFKERTRKTIDFEFVSNRSEKVWQLISGNRTQSSRGVLICTSNKVRDVRKLRNDESMNMLKFRRQTNRSSRSNDSKGASSTIASSTLHSHNSRPEQTSRTTSPRSALDDPYKTYTQRNRAFDRDRVAAVPISEDGRIEAVQEISYKTAAPRRSLSTQNVVSSARNQDDFRRDGKGNSTNSRGRDATTNDRVSRSRSQSQGRESSRSKSRPRSLSQNPRPAAHVPTPSVDSSDQSECAHKRKSKTEKIRQLQSKNELYKEEFKRVQNDRKRLKKELEAKSEEIYVLTSEINSHLAMSDDLKLQLSEAFKKLEKTENVEYRDQSVIGRLTKALDQAKEEHNAALRRVSGLKKDLNDLREYVRRKDEQIETLTVEVSTQETKIYELVQENKNLRKNGKDADTRQNMIDNLVDENKKLQSDLENTLDRATGMVREREEAIADLLKENDELKNLLEIERTSRPEAAQDVLNQLRDELQQTVASLEEAQDRNIELEDEIETWINRGNEMEGMIERLNCDIECWQTKAKAAEVTLQLVETQCVDAKANASSAQEALHDAEAQFEREVQKLTEKHEKKIAEMEAKAFSDRVEKPSAESQQALLLQEAVRNRKEPKSQAGINSSGWRRILAGGSQVDEEEFGDDDTRMQLKKLEKENDAQSKEIKELRSELVRLRSSHNEVTYTSKKTIERLEDENANFKKKIDLLEEQLHEGLKLENSLPSRTSSDDSSAEYR
jgi:hypothetical protein